MQHHHVAGAGVAQAAQHGGQVEPGPAGVEVGVGADREPGGLEHLGVVRPGRNAQPDRGVGPDAAYQVAGNPQGTGASRGVNDLDAAFRDGRIGRPEDQLADGGEEVGSPAIGL